MDPAGNQLEFMDAQGRVLRQALSGDAAKEAGAVALIRDLIAADSGLAEYLVRAGQLPPGFLSLLQAPAPAAPSREAQSAPATPGPSPASPAPARRVDEQPESAGPAERQDAQMTGLRMGPHPTAEDAAHYESEKVCASCCSSAGGAWRYASYVGQKGGTMEERQPYWGCCSGADWPSNWASVPSCSSLGNFGCGTAYSCGGICGGFRCAREQGGR